MQRFVFRAVVACLCVGALTGSGRADLINVDFNLNGGPSGLYTGAAVLGAAGDGWNGVGGSTQDMAARTNLSLRTSTHVASGVTLSFSGQTGFFDASNTAVFDGTPFAALMNDYIFAAHRFGQSVITVSFDGLTPDGSYRLILYSAANHPGRETIFTVNGSSETVADPGGSKTLQEGLNYADFTTTADAGGHLSFTVSGAPNDEGDLNGFQLQSLASANAVPEPASLTLLVTGAVGLIGCGRAGRLPFRASRA